jgi:hypothetical protein
MIYWTPENQTGIKNYLIATTKEEKNKIFNDSLYTSIHLMCKQVLYNRNNVNDDDLQELLIFVVEKVLPKVDETKIKATFNFIWVSINRRAISMYNAKKIHNKVSYESDITTFDNYSFTNNTYEYDTIMKEEEEDIRRQIINEIDSKIEEEKIINKTNTIFLILLKEHILNNEFNVSNFRKECMERMNIDKGSFWNIASSLNIRTKIMNNDMNLDSIN